MPPIPQRTRISNGKLALAAGICISLIGLAPVAHLMLSPASKVDGSKGLPAQASMRGAYINTGSRDVGPDNPV
jgi:hypothetical protein